MYVITKVKIVYLNLTLHFAIKAVQDFKMHGTQLHGVIKSTILTSRVNALFEVIADDFESSKEFFEFSFQGYEMKYRCDIRILMRLQNGFDLIVSYP